MGWVKCSSVLYTTNHDVRTIQLDPFTQPTDSEHKQNTMKSTHLVSMIIAATLPASALLAQEEHGKMGGIMKGDDAKMAEMYQKMEAEMKAQNAEVDSLVAAMNSATGEKKVDAIAALVSKFVEQRKAIQERMAEMHKNMQGGMTMKGKTESSPSPSGHQQAILANWI